MTPEDMKLKRRAILLKILNQPEFLVELKEIKEYLMVLSAKELKYAPDSKLVEAIEKMSELLKNLPEIEENIRPIVKVVSPDKIKLDWGNVPEDMKPKEIDWDKMPKPLKKIEVDKLSETLDKSLEKILPKSEMPTEANMTIGPNNLWEDITISYPDEKIKISIDRNRNDVIRRLTFTRE